MGIRVNKVLGYGLVDVVVEDDEIVDPRFSQESILNSDLKDEFSVSGYYDYLETLTLSSVENIFKNFELKNKISSDITRCFVHGSEYLIPEVFVCVPLSNVKNWARCDDIIDYYEELYVKKTQSENNVFLLDGAIYPYLSYWDNRDGREIGNEAFQCKRFMNELNNPDYMEALAKSCGFEDFETCRKHLKPRVPDQIQWLIEYGNIFTDPKYIFQLQPLIYTFWS